MGVAVIERGEGTGGWVEGREVGGGVRCGELAAAAA